MQENIIGYLLGALDDDEMARFEAELEADSDLQLLVQDAARSLQVLGDDTALEPPPGLLEATTTRIREFVPSQMAVRREPVGDSGSWSLFDMIVAASVLFVGCMLFVPAIQGSRIHAQIAGCQDNLRDIGRALIQFSENDERHAFPGIPNDRRTGIAGIYATKLREAGFLTEEHNFYCPSYSRQDLCMEESIFQIPSLEDFSKVHGPALARLQASAGGTYGYILGFFKDGSVQAVRNEDRHHYAICADQPSCEAQPNHQPLTHRNVLFETGAVRLFPCSLVEWNEDRLFEDALGRVQAGVDKNDIVIGASATRPVPWCQ